ncbi:MAG: hypothetical protein GX545_06585 [Fibrobacter sp.]|nr:hypothetical protein [Fibrobacter sp.]
MINKYITGFTLLLLSTILLAQQPDTLIRPEVSNSDSILNTINPVADSSNAPNISNSIANLNIINQATDSTIKPKISESTPDLLTKQEKKPVPSYTTLSGEVHGFLTKDKSPYLVTQSISVPLGRVLIIEPGVVILFKEGASFSIDQGQLIAGGTRSTPIYFKGTDSSTVWNGLSIKGEKKSDLRYVKISGAKTAIMLKEGSLNIHNCIIQNSAERGLFAIQSNLKITKTLFRNNAIGAHLATHNESYFEENRFLNNEIGLYLSPLSNTQIVSTTWKENQLALLYMINSKLVLHRCSIENNEVGISTSEMLRPESREQVKNNKINFLSDTKLFSSKIPLPEGIDLSIKEEPKAKESSVTFTANDSTKWSIAGNISAGLNYRYVYTRHNHGVLNEIVNEDTIHVKEDRFPNLWEVPGFGFNTSIYLILKSNKNQSLELSTNFYSDKWNRTDLDVFSLSYTDNYHSLKLGDFYLASGEVFLEGLPVFGANYELSLLKNKEDHPLFTFGGFFGESQKPFIKGIRNPDIYKDWIDEGELKAQRLAWGGDFKWDPLRRFNAHFGVLFSDDEIDDPLLRDGDRATAITADPLQSTMALYAEGNWLFFPGDIELNGQIALGRSDTADVIAQRAINQVFEDAGLSTSSFTTLRQLMQNSNLIQTLSREEMTEIFGNYTTLTNSEMRDSLSNLIQEAKKKRDDFKKDTEDSRTMGLDFTSQNVAIGASLFWNIKKTTLFGHIHYVGENYYSPGSPNQLSDIREFGGYLKQEVSPKWTFKFSYELDVENAANDTALNIFGLSEGTRLGLFDEPDSLYLKEHELDIDRTKYRHDIGLENTFSINKNTDLFFNYQFEYQRQHRPYRLRGLYDAESGIFNDPWFRASTNSDTTNLVYYRDTILVDSARWSDYQKLTTEPYIASDFEEHFYKHTFDLGFSFSFWKSELRINGIWTTMLDGSFFNNDSLIEDIDFSDSTWSKLGYYFNGANYFEHRYPISLQTTNSKFTNRLTLTPRFKNYERNEMKETEWSLSNALKVPLFSKFITLGLSVEMKTFRFSWKEADYTLQDTLTQEKFHYYRVENNNIVATNNPIATDSEVGSHLNKIENGYELISELEEKTEKENDFIVEVSAKINHTKQLFSEWICRGEVFDRPDQISNEYKDLYVGFTINYSF